MTVVANGRHHACERELVLEELFRHTPVGVVLTAGITALPGISAGSFGRAGAWNARVPGLALPRSVLEKLGHLNAERVLKM